MKKSLSIFLVIIISVLLLLLIFRPKMMWIVYLEEAVQNTLHPNCPALSPFKKPLLLKGTKLKAKTNLAELQIESIDDQTRKYRWRSSANNSWEEQTVRLKGGDGINLNYPGNRSEDLLTFVGLKHNIIAFEGIENHSNLDDLKTSLKNYWITHGAVFTRSGLLVGCDPQKPNILVLQILVNGQIPHNLPGASESSISFLIQK